MQDGEELEAKFACRITDQGGKRSVVVAARRRGFEMIDKADSGQWASLGASRPTAIGRFAHGSGKAMEIIGKYS